MKKSAPLGPMIVGLGGVAVLLSLGVWQLQRLQWKNGLIAEAEQRMAAEPEALPIDPDPERDDYKPVFATGVFDNTNERYVLTSLPPHGPGFKVISPFRTGDRLILVDRGFVPQDKKLPEARPVVLPASPVRVEGVLRWPDDTNRFTPAPDPAIREWYARDVVSLAESMKAEPLMIVQTKPIDGPSAEWPRINSVHVSMRNQHLGYALTWFSLAAIWAVMSLLWFRKLARDSRGA